MRRAGRAKAVLIGALVIVAAAVAFGVYVVNAGLSQTPAWWEPVRQTQSHPDADDAARYLEAFTTTQITEARPEADIWTLRIPAAHLNAWLATRFPAWVTNQRGVEWPEDLEAVGVVVGDGTLTVAASTRRPDSPRVLWLTLVSAPDDSPQLLEVDTAGINAIGLPIGAFEAAAPPGVLDRLRDALQTRALPIDEAREVVVERLDLEQGAMVFTLTTRKMN